MSQHSTKMDTQGMSAPLTPEEIAELKRNPQQHKPATVQPRRLFTDTFVKELRILINEVLDEREGKTGITYFDTDQFKYRLGEEEPPYQKYK